jgi:hypothetical protein
VASKRRLRRRLRAWVAAVPPVACVGKRRYFRLDLAEEVARRLRAVQRERGDPVPIRAYPCPACSEEAARPVWHCGHVSAALGRLLAVGHRREA